MSRWIVRLAVVFIVISIAMNAEALACKYSVRDVGFVDVGSSPYRLFVCTDSHTSSEWIASARAGMAGLFADTNIVAEWIHSDHDADHEAVIFLREQKASSYPAVVLRSPEGHKLHVALSATALGADAMRTACEPLVSSALRTELLQRVLTHHSVVLLVEGSSNELNQEARAMAEGSIIQIRASLDSLPKPIDRPPHLLVVTSEPEERDVVLLWSLGIPQTTRSEAYLVAIFGRGRRMGSPIRLPGATQGDLVGRLSYVGQDCECELDRGVMLGTMIPHRWDIESEAYAVKQLGFDPGNPLVKAEIGRILTRGPNTGRLNRDIGELPTNDLLVGYMEIDIDPVAEGFASDNDLEAAEVPSVAVEATERATSERTTEEEGSVATIAEHAERSDEPFTGIYSAFELPNRPAPSPDASIATSHENYWLIMATASVIISVALLSGLWVLLKSGGDH